MNGQMKTDFLRKRMVQLREANGYTLSQLAAKLIVDKSTLSRVEKVGGSTSFNKVEQFAKEYCDFFKLGEQQTKMFMRGTNNYCS